MKQKWRFISFFFFLSYPSRLLKTLSPRTSWLTQSRAGPFRLKMKSQLQGLQAESSLGGPWEGFSSSKPRVRSCTRNLDASSRGRNQILASQKRK